MSAKFLRPVTKLTLERRAGLKHVFRLDLLYHLSRAFRVLAPTRIGQRATP